tara:strand:+ start:2623 stop:3042 length:420 start_codon:yes stop_codon:yes gene_type:complete
MILDAKDLIVGRMATFVAKKSLLGEKIDVVNCEKAIITGNKKEIFERYRKQRDRGGPFHGPFLPKMPDRFLRRSIRGMLPYKQEKGRKAFERIMCHISVPKQFKDKKMETVKEANISRIKTLKYITVGDICRFLKGKEW